MTVLRNALVCTVIALTVLIMALQINSNLVLIAYAVTVFAAVGVTVAGYVGGDQ